MFKENVITSFVLVLFSGRCSTADPKRSGSARPRGLPGNVSAAAPVSLRLGTHYITSRPRHPSTDSIQKNFLSFADKIVLGHSPYSTLHSALCTLVIIAGIITQ